MGTKDASFHSVVGQMCEVWQQKKIEFCHIKPTPVLATNRGRGQNQRARDIIEHPDCYVPYCSDCHVIVDGKSRRTEKQRIAREKRLELEKSRRSD